MSDISDSKAAQTTSDTYVDTATQLRTEFLNTKGGTTGDTKKLGELFQKDERDWYHDQRKPGEDSRGKMYTSFLLALADLDDKKLTHDKIHEAKNLPFLDGQEKEMLEFTDKNFDLVARIGGEDTPGFIDGADYHTLNNYPEVPQPSQAYIENIGDKAGWAGAAVGAVAEVGTYIAHPGAGISVSLAAGQLVGLLTMLKTGNMWDAIDASAVATAAWGPAAGGMGGYLLGKAGARTYYDMTERRQIGKLYKGMESSVPTWSQWSGRQ